MDNSGSRSPEADVVLGAGGREEVVDLLVDVLSASKILLTTDLSLDQVVTVHLFFKRLACLLWLGMVEQIAAKSLSDGTAPSDGI